MRPGYGRRDPFVILLLIGQLFQEYNQRGIPPLTLGTIISQIIVHLRGMPFQFLGSKTTACLSAGKIINQKSYINLFTHAIVHGDDWHLYYNMISFLFKGKYLESRMGTSLFGILLAVFTLFTGLAYFGLYVLLGEIFDDANYLNQCAVGFSGVIFALKVVSTYESRFEELTVFGVPVGPYSVWTELIIISLISRNASFVGHLAGILVGLGYIYGPLKPLVNWLHAIQCALQPFETATTNNIRRNTATAPRFYGSGSSGHRQLGSLGPAPNQNHYVPEGLDEEEQIRRATEESIRLASEHQASQSPMPSTPPLSLEEIRQRRLRKLTR